MITLTSKVITIVALNNRTFIEIIILSLINIQCKQIQLTIITTYK